MTAIVCSTRMSIAADRINQALEACDSLSAKIKLAKSHPEFLRAGIKFLTFKHSPQDFVTMMDRLIQCRCDFRQKGMRWLHTPSRCRTDGLSTASGTDLVFDAVATVIQCVILALSELTQHKFRTGNSSDDERPWPQGPEDLLPFGPKDSVDGLELWAAQVPNGYSIFELAGHLASFYGPFGVEVFQYPNYTFPLARTFQHLRAAITFYHEGDSSPLAREHFFTLPIITIFQFFDALFSIDLNHFKKMIFLRGDWLKPTLTSLTTLLPILPPEHHSRIRMFVSWITSFANAKWDPKTEVVEAELDYSLLEETTKQLDQLEVYFHAMRETRKLGCWNIQCPSQYEAIHTRLCGRCTLIRFCGEKVSVFNPGNTPTGIKVCPVSKGCVEVCSTTPQGSLRKGLLFERSSWLCRLVTLVDN